MEKLSEKDRDIIREYWDVIKASVEKSKIFESTYKGLHIKAIDREFQIELILIKTVHIRIIISKKAKIITFKYYSEKSLKERKELIYTASFINDLIKRYNMEHPVYSKKEDNSTLNISVDDEKSETIFNDPSITEIFDDKFELYTNETNFLEYKNKIELNASDYYNENFSENNYSTQISNDKIIMNEKRDKLIQFINGINTKNRIIFLVGCQKIGLTLTIKICLKASKILYINFEDINKIKKTSDKRKYLFYMFFNLFNDFEEYNNFIEQHIFKISGYDNILNVISSIITIFKDNLNDKKITIILDNYDDNLVGDTKLSKTYIEDLYKKIQNNNIYIIFLGRGKYISDLLIKYFYRPHEIEHYILFKYYFSLDLNIENIIHNINVKKGINEVEDYFTNKYNNQEYVFYNFIVINNLINIINELFENEMPFHFFKFQKENDKLKIDFQFDDLFEANNKKIKEYAANFNNFNSFQSIKNHVLKGIVFEELIVAIFANNKSFKNLKFPGKNILEVDEIYDMKNIIVNENLEDGPILIKQSKNGAVFDFGFVFNNKNIEYFIGVQAGLNKTAEDILDYCLKLESFEKKIMKDISKLTKREITQFRFIIILNDETQKELKKEYDNIYSELNISRNKTNYEKSLNEDKRNRLNHFNTVYGIVCCQNANITYYSFSIKDFCFYQKENEKIEDFDVDKINLIKKGFDYFCRNEYHLILNDPLEIIMTDEEKELLLNELKTSLPDSDIEEIRIIYKINARLPLLTGTPSNCGILTITKDIKLFTYFNGTYTHFLIQNNQVKMYKQNEQLFANEYNNNCIISRYFVNLISKEEKQLELQEENQDNLKEDITEEKNEAKSNQKKINKEKLKKEFKEEQLKYANNLVFLQNKRKKND